MNNLRDNNISWQISGDFTQRLTQNKALIINSLWVKNDNAQVLDITQNQTRQFYTPSRIDSTPTPFLSFNQSLEKPMEYLSNTAQLFYSNQKIDFTVSGSTIFRREDLRTQLRLNNEIIADSDFINNAVFEQKNMNVGINLGYNWGNKRLFFNTSGGFFDQKLTDNILTKNSLSKNGFYTLPTIGFNWKKKKNLFYDLWL
ncbi:MAG: hypothetical protein HC817_09735 [Saprospiraceae bacterium]|nr:hypothetical protein [Saprospiraceae bacterium]